MRGNPLALVLSFLILATLATYVVPAGQFDRRQDAATGRTVVVPGSFHSVPPTPVGPWLGWRRPTPNSRSASRRVQSVGARAAELAAGDANRLTSVVQSIEVSLRSSRMTDPARRLFAILGQCVALLAICLSSWSYKSRFASYHEHRG